MNIYENNMGLNIYIYIIYMNHVGQTFRNI